MRVITSGGKFLDIDAYGGCVAYAELLRLQGIEAQAVSTAPMNNSIPANVRQWPAPLARTYAPSPDDRYTLIDVSEPEYFETFVDVERIDELIDHHPGLEQYWNDRIGNAADIERVGAACTQVYERWTRAGKLEAMSQTSARLLMCGILDNTLNFGADITTERDRSAYDALADIAGLPADWPAQYFSACQQAILSDIVKTIKDDTKVLAFRTFPGEVAIGQLCIWDSAELINQSFDTIQATLSNSRPEWFMNVISIKDDASYLTTDSPRLQQWLSETLHTKFDGNVAKCDRSWLRKEIMQADIDRAGSR